MGRFISQALVIIVQCLVQGLGVNDSAGTWDDLFLSLWL